VPRDKNPHGQYFTPAPVARLMRTLLTTASSGSVLEPCAGEGVFLDVLASSGFTDVTAVEIDPLLVAASTHDMTLGSFVSWSPPRSFDAVIGNPPYIRWRDLDETSRTEVQAHPLYKELFNSLSDYLTVFIAASVDLLVPGGELVFITPSFWMHTEHSGPLREWLLTKGAITDIIDFQEASVFPGVGSAIVIFRFEKGASTDTIRYARYQGPRRLEGELDLGNQKLFFQQEIDAFQPKEHWSLASPLELTDAMNLERICTEKEEVVRLGAFVDIANGMVSGLDKAFRIPAELWNSLPTAERAASFEVIKAAQIEPYVSTSLTRYINLPTGMTKEVATQRYPNLVAHLTQYREALENRYAYQRDLPFYEWAFKRSEHFFLNDTVKGFVPCKERLTSRPEARFTLASGAVATQDVTAFATKETVRESIAYVVAYLNQPLVTKWVRTRGLMKGGVAEFSERPLGNIPFRTIDWENPKEVAAHNAIDSAMRALLTATPGKRHAVIASIEKQFSSLLR
jgi:adenine-specific DNA-methyltransferase